MLALASLRRDAVLEQEKTSDTRRESTPTRQTA